VTVNASLLIPWAGETRHSLRTMVVRHFGDGLADTNARISDSMTDRLILECIATSAAGSAESCYLHWSVIYHFSASAVPLLGYEFCISTQDSTLVLVQSWVLKQYTTRAANDFTRSAVYRTRTALGSSSLVLI
jgi:hypothetical protein